MKNNFQTNYDHVEHWFINHERTNIYYNARQEEITEKKLWFFCIRE